VFVNRVQRDFLFKCRTSGTVMAWSITVPLPDDQRDGDID
jgi:hypothetical protein